jgi:hypothetical protein
MGTTTAGTILEAPLMKKQCPETLAELVAAMVLIGVVMIAAGLFVFLEGFL